MSNFVGSARRITATEVAQAAAKARVPLARFRAVMAVESRNSGYDGKRRPLILFEPHVFYRNLSGNMRSVAVARGLAYQRWGQMRYPAGSDAQYLRLAEAIKINEEAAYRAISMGMGQVLGENYKAAGCSSAKEMFEEAKESEANQLQHMINYCDSRGLMPAWRAGDWVRFARYNGTGQIEKYASWLKREEIKWTRIVSKPRAELDAKDLKDAGSKIITAADTGKKAVATVAAPTIVAALEVANQALEPASKAVDTAKNAQGVWGWFSDNWQFVLLASAVGLVLFACYWAWRSFQKIEEERVQNAREGLNVRI
jgi:hypothetical protein